VSTQTDAEAGTENDPDRRVNDDCRHLCEEEHGTYGDGNREAILASSFLDDLGVATCSVGLPMLALPYRIGI